MRDGGTPPPAEGPLAGERLWKAKLCQTGADGDPPSHASVAFLTLTTTSRTPRAPCAPATRPPAATPVDAAPARGPC